MTPEHDAALPERESFERWASTQRMDLRKDDVLACYLDSYTGSAWTGWCAAIAQHRAQESEALRDVAAERRRQVEAEGWTPEHDDEHDGGELALAGGTYALLSASRDGWRVDDHWPWDLAWLKKSDPRRMLVKAGALILAEIERLDRATPHTKDAT
jgi:hypothetical protein